MCLQDGAVRATARCCGRRGLRRDDAPAPTTSGRCFLAFAPLGRALGDRERERETESERAVLTRAPTHLADHRQQRAHASGDSICRLGSGWLHAGRNTFSMSSLCDFIP